MSLKREIEIPTFADPLAVEFNGGSSAVFIGANGAGKTRLGVWIENQFSSSGTETHRIAAHRSLNLNPNVIPPNLEVATKRLWYGYENGNFNHKPGHRWRDKPATALLDDFEHLLAALYAENNEVSVAFRQAKVAHPRQHSATPIAKIDKLREIWETVLPHRKLIVLAGNLKTAPADDPSAEYAASDMSDGERVIFYLIGQALLAPLDSVLIFDEPELHINKSIVARVWDEIESARPDCAFVYITHDVEFAASRHAANRFALRAYRSKPEAWDIEAIPDDAGLPDDVTARIVGSRKPVLFVEGDGGSLDGSLYRRVYDGFTVLPVGPCDQVIHTVASFASQPHLHRVGCAGMIDADGRSDADAARLESKGVYRLPVAEVENLLLLPTVFLALAQALNFKTQEAQDRLGRLRAHVFAQATSQADDICLRYTKRRIDAEMKRIGLASKDVASLSSEFRSAANSIDPTTIFNDAKVELTTAITSANYERVLLLYDNKGLLAEAAKLLGYQSKALEEFIGRTLRDDASGLRGALAAVLPTIVARP